MYRVPIKIGTAQPLHMMRRLHYPPNVFISYSRNRKISRDQKMPYSSQFRWKFDCRPNIFFFRDPTNPPNLSNGW